MASDFSKWLEIARDPFVLIDFQGTSQLWRSGSIIEARHSEDVLPILDRLRGQDAVGFLSYEAAFGIERKLAAVASPQDLPLLWFMADASVQTPPLLPDASSAWASAPEPLIGREDYLQSVTSVQSHILEGDIYQANFTFQNEVRTIGHPLSIYAQLRERAQGLWSAAVFTGDHWILSSSPELFFTCDRQGQVTCRPMKGTAAAGSDPQVLRADPKQRAENLMIVDLLRNDLSRVARPFTVRVPDLFAVEAYPTVLQLTSTVTGQLREGLDPIDLLLATFPCGSITGAPKIRAMEIIGDVEQAPRGIYTGSIGQLSADGSAAFNVAIRTLVMRAGANVARLGLGAGIVADSRPAEEWEECRRRGAFVATRPWFKLLETMRVDEAGQVCDLAAHLDRLERSARTLGFKFDRAHLITRVESLAAGPRKLRLELGPDGEIAVETSPLPETPDPADVVIVERTASRHDFRLQHKTSDRSFYDEPRLATGAFEVLFVDQAGFVTEGSFTNLFVSRGERLATPPAERGLLPGILRQRLLATGQAFEEDVLPEDLAHGFYLGNALRGLIPAQLRKTASQH